MNKRKTAVVIVSVILIFIVFLYAVGITVQLKNNYAEWIIEGGMTGKAIISPPSFNPMTAVSNAFTFAGIKTMLVIVFMAAIVFLIYKLHDRFDNGKEDERGFKINKTGVYGTASWMDKKEMNSVLEIGDITDTEGVILGEYNGKVISMPNNTRLNRHIAVFGASGTGKSRCIIRNRLFGILKSGESVIVTDPKGELYSDTAEMYRQNGYDVRVYNLVNPTHSDSWNCMSDLEGDTLMAQVLTSVIIGNTSSAKSDRFWDNGEANLLKALVLYIDLDRTRKKEDKNLSAVYQLLINNSERQLTAMFQVLPMGHPAKAPFNLFCQSSDTVRAGIILGLGTRLQVLQDISVRKIISRSDIELTEPAKKKCAYYIILSDGDTTLSFLSSLFFSFLFIRLTRFADSTEDRRCPVPVNLILDEFNNIGKIGGAEDGSDFARSLSVCRSRDIRVMLAVQSLGQLQNRYSNNLWSEIIGNCDIQLMLGCTDDVTAKYFSERSGEMSIIVEGTMTTRKTIAVAQMIPQYRQNISQGKRKLLTPDEVLRLPNDELLCVVRGYNVLKLKKLDYTKHPFSKRIIKKSVFEYYPSQFGSH